MTVGVSLVIPTVGRPSLDRLWDALASSGVADARAGGALPVEVLLVPDRPGTVPPRVPASLAPVTTVVPGGGTGPAAARNRGWRAARYPWVAFLDDDVVPDRDWLARLWEDLAMPPDVGGVQGRVRVPLPAHRRPTDRERATAGLVAAAWITADMAYRWAVLAEVGGFDERLPRAYREDAELAYRVRAAGWRLLAGGRAVTHPVRPQPWWASVPAQRGNADDALLRRWYGRGWRALLGLPPGRRPGHVVTTVAGVAALVTGAAGARGGAARSVAAFAGAGWLALTCEFAAARVGAGPPAPGEVAAILVTSVAIPPVATVHWLHGWTRGRWRTGGEVCVPEHGEPFRRAG